MKKIDFNIKRISDPIHGSIGLSPLESKIINTKVFQRLRNIKQLGLAHYVFPGADYSRFAHSIGVCHVTGRILSALIQNGADISDPDCQRYRLAALLHDIGHYPFSHTMEEPIKDFYGSSLLKTSSQSTKDDGQIKFFMHERVGKEILLNDSELNSLLENASFAPGDISSIINREKPPKFANLISSDLDADRIDYIMRTAHHSGLPYGSIDLEYLLSQMNLDSNGRICLTKKAIRTADHFLLSRYFDYKQVTFHKTIAGLEMILKDVLEVLFEKRKIDCSSRYISESIKNGEWNNFDDHCIIEIIRTLSEEEQDDHLKLKIKAILERKPPKLIAEVEFMGVKGDKDNFKNQKTLLTQHIPILADQYNIEESLIRLWDKTTNLTKAGSRVPPSSCLDENPTQQKQQIDEVEQVVKILSDDGTSKLLPEIKQSLMSVLADFSHYSLRLYLLNENFDEEKIQEIRKSIKATHPNLTYK